MLFITVLTSLQNKDLILSKMKDIPPVISSEKQKLGKKKRKRIKFHETGNESLIDGNSERLKMKKVKKIKIRLADPDIPDSYICEVFDSSLEREEEEEVRLREERCSGFRGRDKSKQRNFFDVLMSNDLRKNFTMNSAAQNEEIPEKTKLCREVEGGDIVQRRKSVKAKNKEKLIELVKRKKSAKRKINNYCNNNTSDDEDLFEVQSGLQFFSANSEEGFPSNSDAKADAKNKENAAMDVSCDSSSTSDAPLSMRKHKGSNILNYFTKTTSRTVKATVKSKKGNGRLKSRKLTEINMFGNARKEESFSEAESDARVTKLGNMKLAPLFQKKVKTVVDPMVQKARLDFLRNGLPTTLKKINRSPKIVENKYEEVNFPDVSHVQQKDDDPLWSPEDVFIPFMKTNDSVYCSGGRIFRFRIRDEGVSQKPAAAYDEQENQSILNSLRLRYKDLNVDAIFNGFKKKKDGFMRKIKKYDNSGDVIEMLNDSEEGSSCYSLWTDVYRPKSDEIMGNRLTVARLSGWFKSWKEYSNEVKKSSSKDKTLVSLDDSDIFVSSDGDRNGLQSPVNMCLLSGPISSGKTSLVYALATEFDFNVLEVNASSTRTGKKLLLNVEEATKSHQVRSGLNVATTGEKKEEQEMRMKTKKKRRKFAENTEKSNSNQMSLILIEDADIIFEERDEGFVAAISTLVQSSKRPFIFLSNDPNYGYLERLKQQQILLLEMRRPSFQNARAVLDIIASVEGIRLNRETLDNVIQGNNYDLRKSILELQFWVQSGKGLIRNVGVASELGKLWWGLNKFLYNKECIHVAKIDCRKRKKSSDFYDSSGDETEEASKKAKLNAGLARATKNASVERKSDSSIHAYARILDFMLVSDLFKYGSDLEPIPLNEYRPNDGLSLNECMESVNYKVKDLSGSIIEELVTTSARVFASCDELDASCVLSNPPWSEIRWRNIHHDAKQDLVSLLPSHGSSSKRNIHLDYLPIMRNMCRAERNRYNGNTKRKNRFYHYFRTLGCNPREESLEISCDILSI